MWRDLVAGVATLVVLINVATGASDASADWSRPVELPGVFGPLVAMNASGAAMVLGSYVNTSDLDVVLQRAADGHFKRLAEVPAGVYDLAVDRRGRAIVAGTVDDGSHHAPDHDYNPCCDRFTAITVSRASPQARVQTLSPPEANAGLSRLAVNRRGEAVALWSQTRWSQTGASSPEGLFSAIRSPDGRFRRLKMLDHGEIGTGTVVLDERAGATAVWSHFGSRPNARPVLMSATRAPNAARFSKPRALHKLGPAGTEYVAMAVDRSANVTVVWADSPPVGSTPTTTTLRVSRRRADGSFGRVRRLRATPAAIAQLQVVAGAGGQVRAVWREFSWGGSPETSRSVLYTAIAARGRPFGRARRLPQTEDAFTFDLAGAPDGSTALVWTQHDGSGSVMRTAILRGLSLSTLRVLSRDATGWSTGPSLALDDRGRGLAVWSDERTEIATFR